MRQTTALLMGLLFAAAAASPVQAAPLQSTVGTTYESYTDQVFCSNTTQCVASFLPLPAGKTYFIERLRCYIVSPGTPIYMAFGPTVASGSTSLLKKNFFSQLSAVNSGMFNHYTYEAVPRMMIGAGKYPTINLQMSTAVTISIDCALSATTVQSSASADDGRGPGWTTSASA